MQRPGSISAAIPCKSGVALMDTESHCACDCCNEMIPGHDLGDTARFGLGDTVAVKQGVGRDGDEAKGRERRDA